MDQLEHQIRKSKIAIANADFTIDRNREIIESLTSKLESLSAGPTSYDAESVRQMAEDIIREARDRDEDEGEDLDVTQSLQRLFLERQALIALNAILAFEDVDKRHFSFETCRRFAFWIQAELEPHECGRVMTADEFLREFAGRVGCESVMMEHNPLFFRGDYKEHCSRVDFKERVARFMHLIKSPVEFTAVQRRLGL
jgi:hypothetical protein